MGLAVRPGARALAQARWLDAVGEAMSTSSGARGLIAAEVARDEKLNELDSRHWVQLRARGLLFTRWKAEAVAAQRERRETVLGEEADHPGRERPSPLRPLSPTSG